MPATHAINNISKLIRFLNLLYNGFTYMYKQCAINSIRSAVSARRRRRICYVCDTFDRGVRCKLGLSAELVGTCELSSGQSSSDRVRRWR